MFPCCTCRRRYGFGQESPFGGAARSFPDLRAGRFWKGAIGFPNENATSLSLAITIAVVEPYHVFVNNAGTNRPNPFTEVLVEDFDVVMNLNVRAAYFAAQSVARRMVAAGVRGSIINMSSQMGHVGGADRSLYCASKWAMEGFSKAMAIDLAPRGIRVNTLCPTFIETPMTKPFFENAAFRETVLAKIKLGRLGTVEDLMGAIVFLGSDASSLMTGSALVMDGGWTAD
jgi:NAD(P)-dependent dehydrogenase (short-subunit alcohol dehydrogenase family)